MSRHKAHFTSGIVLGGILFLGCASTKVERAPTAEHDAFVARAAAATSVLERFQIGVDARLKAGLGFGYFAATRENGVSTPLAAGNRAFEPVVKLSKSDLLEIGSVTKTFTGILVHLAIQDGKLSLETKLSEILPELAGTEAGEITVHELGLHRSGLPREPKGITIPDPANPRHGLDRAEVLAALAKVKLTARPPGETEHARKYSNWGYMTLGIVLEKVLGGNYKDLVEKRVLFPLGMTDSGVDRKMRKHGKWIPKASPGYALDGSPLPLRDYDTFAAATGGIESNATDMAKFLAALENPPAGPLGQAIQAGMASGIGWDSAPGATPFWKNGATSAHTSILVYGKNSKRGIFIGSNTMVSPDDLGFFAEGAATKDTLLDQIQPKRVVSPEEFARLKGTYVPSGPIPAGQPPLRRVDISETFGRWVAHFGYDVWPAGALLVPEADAGLWRVVDGMEEVDTIRATEGGIHVTTELYSGEKTAADLARVPVEVEKYPALER